MYHDERPPSLLHLHTLLLHIYLLIPSRHRERLERRNHNQVFQQFCHRFSYRYIPPPVNSCIPVHITLRVPNRSNLKFQVRVLDFNVHISNGFTALFTKLANTIASDQKSKNKPVGCCVSYSIGFFFNQPHLTADPGRVLVFT